MKVIFDIDSTLADITHLLPLWDTDREQFYSRLGEAKKIKHIVAVFQGLFEEGFEMWTYTSRPERTRTHTALWCAENGIFYDTMLMRADDDNRHDVEVKLEMLENLKPENIIIFEDRSCIVKALREKGFTVLQCAEGNY